MLPKIIEAMTHLKTLKTKLDNDVTNHMQLWTRCEVAQKQQQSFITQSQDRINVCRECVRVCYRNGELLLCGRCSNPSWMH